MFNKKLFVIVASIVFAINITHIHAEYNPEGFSCTINSSPKSWKISMTKPPLYVHQCEEAECELAKTKVYIDSLELGFEQNDNGVWSIKWAIASDCLSSVIDIKSTRLKCPFHNDQAPAHEPYTLTLSISDFFKSAVFFEFSLFGGHWTIRQYQTLEWVVEMINALATAKYGPKILIDEYLQQ